MRIDHEWGKEPKKSTSEKAAVKLEESSAFVAQAEDRLTIKIFGPLANIPSMKNSKLPGKNFINPDFKARIAALESLIKPKLNGFTFGDAFTHMVLVCAEHNRLFDLDGVCATVKDLLEPASKLVGKKKQPRGWGLGVIENDRNMSHEEYYSWQIKNHDPNVTSIYLRRWEQ